MPKIFGKIIILFACVFFCSCSRKSAFLFGIPGAQAESVQESSSSGVHFFLFDEAQKLSFRKFFEANGDAAIFVQLKCDRLKSAEKSSVSFGMFFESDLPSPMHAPSIEKLASCAVITDSLVKYDGKPFALVLCVDKDKELPAGFFVGADSKVSVQNAQVIRACIGHNFSGEVPVFAFGPNGGFNNAQDDFSGASMVFSTVNSKTSSMPVFQIQFEKSSDEAKSAEANNSTNIEENSDFSAGGNRFRGESQKLAFGGEVLTVRKSEGIIEIPSAALKTPFSVLTYPDGKQMPQTVMLLAGDKENLRFTADMKNVISPIKCDPGLVIGWSRNKWRGNDYELYEWDRFPGILFFDISTYDVQDDFFRRLAFFVEKSGYKGRLLSDAELKGKHGYNAHDYKAYDLARFFDKASKENFELNPRELLLRQILAENGVIEILSDGSVAEGRGAVISISQESPDYLRRTFVAHEGWHGIFFEDDDFRNAVASIYYTMDQKSLAYLRRYFQITPSLNYDVNDDYLMKNEFMAYMLQRPLTEICRYYVDMASRNHSQVYAKADADYIIATNASGFESAADLLDQYVEDRWNLNAGRVWMISR